MFKNFYYKFYNVTLILVVINIFMFLLQYLFDPVFTNALVLSPGDVLVRPWILLTSMFLHGGIWHLFFNMYVLLIFGSLVERNIGSGRFLSIYLIGGLFASLIYTLFPSVHPETGALISALGASGAVMAILAIVIVLFPNLQVLFFFVIPMSMRTAGIIIIAFDIFGLFNPTLFNIAHVSHLGGVAIGLVYGYYLLKKRASFNKRFVFKKKTRKNKESIELSDEDIEEYLKNGRL